MDRGQIETLRILIIFAVILLTGIDVISVNPGAWWVYGILVALVIAILFWQRRRANKPQGPPEIAE